MVPLKSSGVGSGVTGFGKGVLVEFGAGLGDGAAVSMRIGVGRAVVVGNGSAVLDGATGTVPALVGLVVGVPFGRLVLATVEAVLVGVGVGVVVVNVLDGVADGVKVAVFVAVAVEVAVLVAVAVPVAVAPRVGVAGGDDAIMPASSRRVFSQTSGSVDQLISVRCQVGSVGSATPYSHIAFGTVRRTIFCTAAGSTADARVR